jgi:hypothetical protein
MAFSENKETSTERVNNGNTILTFSADPMDKVTFFSTGGSLLEYERKTWSKAIVPFAGQSLGGLLSVMVKPIITEHNLLTKL